MGFVGGRRIIGGRWELWEVGELQELYGSCGNYEL